MAKATLLVVHGVDPGTRFALDEGEVQIGRGGRNDIRILDTEMSRKHATIRSTEDGFLLIDRQSSNGTYVNGALIQTHRLRSGDQIQMGCTSILFTELDDSAGSRDSAVQQVDISEREDFSDASQIVDAVGPDARQRLFESSLAVGDPQAAQTIANLQTLYRIAEEAVRPSLSIDQFLQRILEMTIEVVDADRGCMLIHDAPSGELVPRVYGVRRGEDTSRRMPVSRTIIDYVLAHKQGVRTSDARTDQRFQSGQSILQAGIREAMCVPMQGRYEQIGVIYLDTTTPGDAWLRAGEETAKFNEDKLRLLVAIGRQTALAIEDNRFQQALVKAERFSAMGQTIATLSHHIKNILQGVRGGSYLIDMGLKQHNEDLIARGWKIVEKNQDKIYHLVMDMLSFSTERKPALERASLSETVGDVVELMQARAEECGVRLVYEACPVPETLFDPEGIHRAVLNVVSNAVDAAEGQAEGTVEVRVGRLEGEEEVFVEVLDNGPGIPAEQLSKIFHVFESTKGSRGTGLGLAVSQKIVREHGGDISVESEPGHGARFVITLPISSDEPQTMEQQVETEQDRQSLSGRGTG